MTLTKQRQPLDGEALSYDRLEEPWRDWAKIASRFIQQVDGLQDREDLMHDIIMELAEVAEEYRQKGKLLTKGGCMLVAKYARFHFYDKKRRWKRVSSIDLNSKVRDKDGSETNKEFIDTLIRQKKFDLDNWIDVNDYYRSCPENVKQAIQKLIKYGAGKRDGNNLSGYDWRLIREFRRGFKEKALVKKKPTLVEAGIKGGAAPRHHWTDFERGIVQRDYAHSWQSMIEIAARLEVTEFAVKGQVAMMGLGKRDNHHPPPVEFEYQASSDLKDLVED